MAERGASGGGSRPYSGSGGGGGNVVSYQDLESLDVDQYDFINAPQYVDFNDLAKSDDPNADLYFETHREEDDFMISIDSISPTVQFLNKDSQDMSTGFTEDLQEAKEQKDDVEIIYEVSSNKDTECISLDSSTSSSNNCDDKENYEPITHTPEIKDMKDPAKKLSYSAALSPNRVGRQPLSEERNSSKSNVSLLAQLEKLQILSSDEDEEDVDVETIEEVEYNSPTKSVSTDDVYVDSVLKTPGAVMAKLGTIEEPKRYTTLTSQKLDFFAGLSIVTPSPSHPLAKMQSARLVSVSNDEVVDKTDELVKTDFPVFQGPGGEKENLKVQQEIKQENPQPDTIQTSLQIQIKYETSQEIVQVKQEINEAISLAVAEALDNVKVVNKENIATNAVANKKLKLKQPSSSARPPLPPVKSNQYVSVAEAIQKFQKNTPDRFKSIPRIRGQTVAPGQKTTSAPLRTTIPQPFKLSTAKPRPVKKEEPEFKFKARPAPPKTTSTTTRASHIPVASNDKHKVTTIKPFSSSFDQRNQELLRKKEEKVKQIQQEAEQQRLKELTAFHATPPIVLQKTVHKAQPFKLPKQFELKASLKPLTIPQSPAFNPLPSQRRTTPTKKDA